VLSPKGELLLEGKQTAVAPFGDLSSGGGFYKSAQKATQLLVVDLLTKLRPDASKYPAAGAVKDVSAALLIDHENAVASGTGFFINAKGQVLTAAHVIHDCVQVDVKRDDKTFPSKVTTSSNLLDLAVIDTDTPVTRFLPFRKTYEIILGEAVTNVGFPLQKILASTPNLTRGNVSSRGALAGSVGQFQFSAPIQPGSSGGPVVSDGGELLGITVATLNAAKLVESGALPQNVNFALESRYAAMFLRKNSVAFTEVEPNFKGDIRTSNEAAFLYQLLVRSFGTNNLPDCSNMCHESSGSALTASIGIGKGSVSIDDVAMADLIVVAGQNPGTNHPRMLSVLETAKRNGAKIIAVNPLPEAGLLGFRDPQRVSGVVGHGTAIADEFLQIRIGGDMALSISTRSSKQRGSRVPNSAIQPAR
jgi:hypothetical protein